MPFGTLHIAKPLAAFEMKQILSVIILAFLIASCSDSDKILYGHNFDNGDWLLVNVNYAEKTLELIDDELILKNNKNGIWVTLLGDCGGTTCDGFLMLYKDGKLIKEDEYLTRSTLIESNELKNSYQKGIEWTIEPINETEFRIMWDSLKNENVYPTVYHTQPEDKDIIWAYKIEEE